MLKLVPLATCIDYGGSRHGTVSICRPAEEGTAWGPWRPELLQHGSLGSAPQAAEGATLQVRMVPWEQGGNVDTITGLNIPRACTILMKADGIPIFNHSQIAETYLLDGRSRVR